MSRRSRSWMMLAFTAIAVVTLGRAPRPVMPRSRDLEFAPVIEADAGH